MTESKIEYRDAIWSDFYFIVISVYFSISLSFYSSFGDIFSNVSSNPTEIFISALMFLITKNSFSSLSLF